MKQKDIHHFSTRGDTKASVVERFNRTLKQRLYRYFTVQNTLNFVPVLQDLVRGDNRSYHRSIKRAPDQVTQANNEDVWEALYGKKGKLKKPQFKVGDRVRLNKKFRTCKKGYLPGWMEEVFVIRSVKGGKVPTYKVEEWDGTLVEGTFYEQDLQKVNVKDDDLFRIEKIVKRKGNKVLVRSKGWSVKYDSWMEKKRRVKGQVMKEFYVQVMSNASVVEFPLNQPNSFKNCLPNPLELREPGWKVGHPKTEFDQTYDVSH